MAWELSFENRGNDTSKRLSPIRNFLFIRRLMKRFITARLHSIRSSFSVLALAMGVVALLTGCVTSTEINEGYGVVMEEDDSSDEKVKVYHE